MELTAELLRERYTYQPETGAFMRRVRFGPRGVVGVPLGKKSASGHLQHRIGGRFYLVHRLIWLHTHGTWPTNVVDHINGNPADNRLSNLRDVSVAANTQNMRRPLKTNRTSGVLGVSWHARRSKWQAQIRANGKSQHLGYFTEVEPARQAYLSAKRELHQGCTI